MQTVMDFASVAPVELAIDWACAWDTADPEIARRFLQSVSVADKLQWHSEFYSEVLKILSSSTQPSYNTAAKLVQCSLLLKKWRCPVDGIDPKDRARRAIAGFLESNSNVGDRRSVDEATRRKMRDLLRIWLPPIEFDPLPRLGPGAVAEKWDYVDKRKRLSAFAEWWWNRFPLGSWANTHGYPAQCSDTVFGNDCARLCAVPKDWRKDRLITIEPYVNTLAQQAARVYIMESFRSGYIQSLRNPILRAAWNGFFQGRLERLQQGRALSSSRTLLDATVDLSSASDGISYDLVADVMPPHICAWLDVSRTHTFMAPGGEQPVPLRIYAGMGNATTFIVETLVFLAFTEARAQLSGLGRHRWTTVYGDDIICDARLFDRGLLETGSPFFKINLEKSFGSSTALRESCGIFAYQGYDITPIRYHGYDCSQTAGLESLCDVINRSLRHSMLHVRRFGSALAEHAPLLNIEGPVPAGALAMSYDCRPYDEIESRWNRNFQRKELKLPLVRGRSRKLNADRQWCLDAWFLGAAKLDYAERRNGFTSWMQIPVTGLQLTQAWFPAMPCGSN